MNLNMIEYKLTMLEDIDNLLSSNSNRTSVRSLRLKALSNHLTKDFGSLDMAIDSIDLTKFTLCSNHTVCRFVAVGQGCAEYG